MNKVTIIIEEIDKAVKKPKAYPDPIVVAIMSNNLRDAISCAQEWHCTVADLDQLIRFVRSHIPTRDIDRIVKKWGKG